jgi:osmotically-inducible protein OsmY
LKKTLSDLQLKVQTAILDDTRTKEHGIETMEDNGVITLNGRVPSLEISEIAKKIASNVPGVTGVINEIEVQDSEQEIAI